MKHARGSRASIRPKAPALRLFPSTARVSGADVAATLADGMLPILRPHEEHRWRRWRAVLERLEGDVDEPRAGLDLPVCCLDRELWPAAVALAALRDTRATMFDGPAALLRSRRVDLGRGVVVVALPRTLRAEALQDLSARTDGQVSIITGSDLAGVFFTVAKTAAWRPRRDGRSVAAIDELSSEVHADGSRASFDDGRVDALVRSSDLDALVLHVHGEGGHANLRSLVLCGRTDETEHLASYEIPGGCRRHPLACKRATGIGARPMEFSDVRSRSLWLLSCNGLSVAGQGYPSRVSACLGLLDGSAVEILTNDRATAFGPEEVALVRSFATDGISMRAAQRVLNQIYFRRHGVRPFFVVGIGDRGAPAVEGPRRALVRVPAKAHVVQLSDEGTASYHLGKEVLGFYETAAGGRRPKPRRALRATDMTAHATEVQRQLGELRETLRLLAAREGMLRRIYPSEEGLAKTAILERIRRKAEDTATLFQAECAEATTAGVWASRLDGTLANILTIVTRWDEAFASFALAHYFEGALEQSMLADARSTTPSRGAPCDRCGTTTTSRRVEHFGSPLASFIVDCAVCGPLRSWTEDGVRISVSAPASVRRGRSVTLRVERPDALHPCRLVIDVRDKIAHTRVASEDRAWPSKRRVFRFTWPDDAVPDLQTIRVLAVGRGSYCFVRRRIAVL